MSLQDELRKLPQGTLTRISATDDRIAYALTPDGVILAFKRSSGERIEVPDELREILKKQNFSSETVERVDWSKAPNLPGQIVKPGFGRFRGYFFAADPSTRAVRAFFAGAEVSISKTIADELIRSIFSVKSRNPRITPRRRPSSP